MEIQFSKLTSNSTCDLAATVVPGWPPRECHGALGDPVWVDSLRWTRRELLDTGSDRLGGPRGLSWAGLVASDYAELVAGTLSETGDDVSQTRARVEIDTAPLTTQLSLLNIVACGGT